MEEKIIVIKIYFFLGRGLRVSYWMIEFDLINFILSIPHILMKFTM